MPVHRLLIRILKALAGALLAVVVCTLVALYALRPAADMATTKYSSEEWLLPWESALSAALFSFGGSSLGTRSARNSIGSSEQPLAEIILAKSNAIARAAQQGAASLAFQVSEVRPNPSFKRTRLRRSA